MWCLRHQPAAGLFWPRSGCGQLQLAHQFVTNINVHATNGAHYPEPHGLDSGYRSPGMVLSDGHRVTSTRREAAHMATVPAFAAALGSRRTQDASHAPPRPAARLPLVTDPVALPQHDLQEPGRKDWWGRAQERPRSPSPDSSAQLRRAAPQCLPELEGAETAHSRGQGPWPGSMRSRAISQPPQALADPAGLGEGGQGRQALVTCTVTLSSQLYRGVSLHPRH